MPCPYCGGSPSVYAVKYLVIDVCKCPQCGLFFVNPPFLSGREGEDFYERSYSSGATLMPGQDELESMKRDNFRGSPKDFGDRVSVIKKLSGGGRLLEFGSSWGYFLYQARAGGFDATGVEISRKRAAFGRASLGVDIHRELATVRGKFDVICCFHTLEHLAEPGGIFEEFYRMLQPGGRLLLEVPNFDPDSKGGAVMTLIGKVHPLGFNGGFFERNMPRHGFAETVVAGNYEDLLRKPAERVSPGDVVVVHARKAGGKK